MGQISFTFLLQKKLNLNEEQNCVLRNAFLKRCRVWSRDWRVGRAGCNIILNIYLLEQFLEVNFSRLTKYSVGLCDFMKLDIALVRCICSPRVLVKHVRRVHDFHVESSSAILNNSTKVRFSLAQLHGLWNILLESVESLKTDDCSNVIG